MKKKSFKIWSFIWAIVWTIFAGLSWYLGNDAGTIATLGGIALMFAWMYEQSKIED